MVAAVVGLGLAMVIRVKIATHLVVLTAHARAALTLTIRRARRAMCGDGEHARHRQRRSEAFVPFAIRCFCGRARRFVVGERIAAYVRRGRFDSVFWFT